MRAFSKKIASVYAAYSLFLKTVEANVELELVFVENSFQQTDRKNNPIASMLAHQTPHQQQYHAKYSLQRYQLYKLSRLSCRLETKTLQGCLTS